MQPDVTIPSGWEGYSGMYFQHGPISQLPEPYVYTYFIGDTDQMAYQLSKALRTPIEPL